MLWQDLRGTPEASQELPEFDEFRSHGLPSDSSNLWEVRKSYHEIDLLQVEADVWSISGDLTDRGVLALTNHGSHVAGS